MIVTEDRGYDESSGSQIQTLPRAICFAGNCSVGIAAKQQLFLSDPLSAAAIRGIPVFSVRKLSNGSWEGRLSSMDPDTLAPVNTENYQTLIMEKDGVDPNHQINFSIVSGNWGNALGQNLFVTAKANLTGGDSALHYTITGTSSETVPSVSVVPRIYKQTPAGDVLVFTGPAQTCSSGTTCTVRGDFVPVWDISNITSMFFANTTVMFTLPSTGAGAGGLTSIGLQPPETGRAPTVPEVVVYESLSPVPRERATYRAGEIQYGATIEHKFANGINVTTVYDASGKPQFWADDQKAARIFLFDDANLSATHFYANMPAGTSEIVDETGNVTLTATNGDIILNLVNMNPYDRSTSPSQSKRTLNTGNVGTPTIVTAIPGWVEYAKQSYSSPSAPYFGNINVKWIVPEEPKLIMTASDFTQNGWTRHHTTSAVFLGAQTNDLSGVPQGIFQPVLAHNYYADPTVGYHPNYSAMICDMVGPENYAISTNVLSGIKPGDTIDASIYYDKNSWKWTGTISHTTGPAWDRKTNTTTMVKSHTTLDRTRVDLFLTYEAYLLSDGTTSSTHNDQYLMKNIKFDPIVIKDTDGTIISNNFKGYINQIWSNAKTAGECPNLDVSIWSTGTYSVTLKTTDSGIVRNESSVNIT